MSSLASVLPFLAALKKSSPDFSGMTQDAPPPDMVPPGAMAQAPQPQQPTNAPAIPSEASAQIPNTPEDMGSLNAPPAQDKGSFFRLPNETKGHALMRILQGGLQGGLSGMSANAQTYAATGRNAGFGGGAAAGYTQQLPFQRAMQGLELQKAGLTNEQLIQMLPFLRAQTIAGLQKTSSEAQKNLSEAGKAQAETGAIPVKTQLEQAQALAARYKEDPGSGSLIDLQTGQPVSTSGIAPLTAQEALVLGKQPGERVPIKLKNQANEIVNRGYTTVNTEEGVYERNRGTGSMTRLGSNPRMMFAPGERYVPVADPNNPGNITYQKAAIASQQGLLSPQAAPAVTAKATARAVAPGGRVGEEINAFNTAIQHADLLQKAAEALHNGDQQTLNSIKNRFSNEFGATGPITANTIAQAYTREISKMLTSNHMTDAEIGAVGSTLDPNRQSLPQMQAVIGAYRALAQSKMNVRQQGVQQGMQGKPNFPQGAVPTGATGIAPGSDGKRHYHDAQGNDLGVAP